MSNLDETIDSLRSSKNEIYEKLRPLKFSSSTTMMNDEKKFQEDRAHGDDEHENEEKFVQRQIVFVEHSSRTAIDEADRSTRTTRTSISPFSSSLDEFSLEIPIATAEYSNEGLKTDDENGMTKSYFNDDQCEFEIDLGNGSITKSNEKQQRTTSIISADSVRPTAIHHLPFSNGFYEEPQHRPKEYVVYHDQPTNIIFNSFDSVEETFWSMKSLNNVTIASIAVFVSLLIIFFVVFLF